MPLAPSSQHTLLLHSFTSYLARYKFEQIRHKLAIDEHRQVCPRILLQGISSKARNPLQSDSRYAKKES